MGCGVFISYNHKDSKIADALVEILTSLSADLKVFIDHSGLEGGDDYEEKLSRSISQSQWFIIVCSGPEKSEKDMSWCFYEAGQFRVKLQASDQIKVVRDRICFLYDLKKPSQLGRYQGYKISFADRNKTPLSFRTDNDDSISYENTEVFDLLETILKRSSAAPLRDLNDPYVRKLMRGGVRKLTLAFADNGSDDFIDEEVFQPRISFLVSPSDAQGVKPEMIVTGEYNALPNIFSIAGASTTWQELCKKAAVSSKSTITPMWINDLEKAIKAVADKSIPVQTEFLCFGNDGRFYRPIVARNEVFKSGKKKCYVVFIPSRDRRFNISHRASLLLSALILSIRFRQRVLPLVNELNKDKTPDKKKAEILQKLVSEIILVESESVEFGLEPPNDEHDDPPVLNAFHDESDREFMRVEISDWLTSRNIVFDIVREAQNPAKETSWSEAANMVQQKFVNLRNINGMFIDKLCQELLNAERIE